MLLLMLMSVAVVADLRFCSFFIISVCWLFIGCFDRYRLLVVVAGAVAADAVVALLDLRQQLQNFIFCYHQ